MVQAALDGYPAAPVDRACFGTADASVIAARCDEFLRRELGAGIAAPRFYATSTGCVLGVDLEDGRVVVVKVHQPGTEPLVLAAIQRVQRHLHERGFPAPGIAEARAMLGARPGDRIGHDDSDRWSRTRPGPQRPCRRLRPRP